MARTPIPQSEFTPHPAGQHTGLIFEVEVKLNQPTQWGAKHKVVLKVESDTKMNEEDGTPITDEAGNHRGFVIWDWLTVARKEGSRFRDRREAILGRPLNQDEAAAPDFDAHTEFMGQRIGYVVKHRTSDGKLFANIETIWLEGDRSSVDLSANEVATSQVKALEQLVIDGGYLQADKLEAIRTKYAGSSDLVGMTSQQANGYMEVLQNQIPKANAGGDDSDLPF
tara:strand:- start:371 stop:1045 length:675 start_codon:yes stop_codon:yes gene_type:complete